MSDQEALFDAAKEGRLEDVQRLVRGKSVVVDFVRASKRGTDDTMASLRNGDGTIGATALRLAAYNGHLEVVRWLCGKAGRAWMR